MSALAVSLISVHSKLPLPAQARTVAHGRQAKAKTGGVCAATDIETGSHPLERAGTELIPKRSGAERGLDEEAQLIGRCLAGEQGAWEELVRTYTKRVYSICYRFTNSDTEAADLTQDVFLRVFRTLNSFRAGEGSFTVWLSRLSRNLLVDHYRRTKQDRVTDGIEEKLTVLEEKTAQLARTDGMLAGREAGEILQSALVKLSPELREAVILRDLQEMEYREIARVLQVPEGTVKSRLNRGRAELARVLRRSKVTV